jgi:hypothetical protein
MIGLGYAVSVTAFPLMLSLALFECQQPSRSITPLGAIGIHLGSSALIADVDIYDPSLSNEDTDFWS